MDEATNNAMNNAMNEAAITHAIVEMFSGGVEAMVASQESGAPEIAWGDTFFFYDPRNGLPVDHRFPFATMVIKDYPGVDEASNLNRPGVFRLNVGVSKETYQSLFGERAASSSEDRAAESGYDVTALDQVMPHPIYGRMHWVCALNPSAQTFQTALAPLLREAYDLAASREAKRQARN